MMNKPDLLGAVRLARVVEAQDGGGTVLLRDRGRVAARWSEPIRKRGIGVRPGDLVLVAPKGDTDDDAASLEVIWRGPTVVRVTSVDGDRVTCQHDGDAGSSRGVTKTVRDGRPMEQRKVIEAGHEIVVSSAPGEPEELELVDVVVDGLPADAERVLADCVAQARWVWGGGTPGGTGGVGPVSERDPRRIVAEGYDRMAERYAQWVVESVRDEARPRYVEQLLGRLPDGAHVLELGCGGGGPTTRLLAERFAVTGIDISARQIELARANVPTGEFIHGDMTTTDFPPESFDAVVSFYAFGHLPRGELRALLHKIAGWLRPGGVLVATATGINLGTVEANWLGVPMYFSGHTQGETRQFLEAAGLVLETLKEEFITEDGRQTGFLWMIARRPSAGPSAA